MPAPDMSLLREMLVQRARAEGFDCIGFTVPEAIPEAPARLRSFLERGLHGDMHWMEERAEQRAAPGLLWPDVRSIIMLGVNYGPDCDPRQGLDDKSSGVISVYARGDDYHDIIKKRLKAVGRWLGECSGLGLKVFVDTAPVMEKPLAAAAGVGWQGKHTNIVSRQFGSWLFLGAIFTQARFEPDAPEPDRCGSCRACLDACPTAAFPAPRQLDPRRCISYLTIESRQQVPVEFRAATGNRIYGCDDCLAACPWNKFASEARLIKLKARDELIHPHLAELAQLDDAQFRSLFAKNPVKRIGRDRFVRNVLIGIGNSADETLAIHAENLLADASALVRGMAVWALARLAPHRLAAYENYALSEADYSVRREWCIAMPSLEKHGSFCDFYQSDNFAAGISGYSDRVNSQGADAHASAQPGIMFEEKNDEPG